MKAARVVVLTVALAAGGIAALLAGRSAAPEKPKPAQPAVATVDVLVAKTDIDMGKRITAQDVAWQAWPESAKHGNFIRRSEQPDAVRALDGAVARAPFVAGEPIREAKLVRPNGSGFMAAILPPGMRAVSIAVSPESAAAGFILPNDHVDVVLTRRDREGNSETQTSEIILRDIRVLAIDQQLEEKNGQKVVVGKTATLELTPSQVEAVTLARQTGTLSLALRSLSDVGKGRSGELDQSSGDTVNVVRFGVSKTVTPR